MAKRMNDTKAVKAMPAMGGSLGNGDSLSVDVRKIDNGYITRSSSYKNDEYHSRESYSPDKPDFSVQSDTQQESSTLRKAIDSMK